MNTCTELRTGPGFSMSLQPGGMDHIQMLTSILNFSLTVTPTPSQGQPVTLLTHMYASALPWKPVPAVLTQTEHILLPPPGLAAPLSWPCAAILVCSHGTVTAWASLRPSCRLGVLPHLLPAPLLQLTCWAPALMPGTCSLPLESPQREVHTRLALCPDIGVLCLPACLDMHLLPETVRSFPPGTAPQPTQPLSREARARPSALGASGGTNHSASLTGLVQITCRSSQHTQHWPLRANA